MGHRYSGQNVRNRLAGLKVRGLVAALMLWGAGAPAIYAQTKPSPPAGWRFTPLLEKVQTAPSWFPGTDGKVHLVYELLLTNAITVPTTVSAVEVLNAETGATIVRLEGPALLAAMSLATNPTTPTVAIAPSTIGVVWLDIELASPADVPAFVAHRLTIDPAPGIPASLLSFTGDRAAVDRRPPVILGPPLTGAQWDSLGSCCDGPHRRGMMPVANQWRLGQRFAIDFNQLDAQNRPGVGDPKLPASFPTFGEPVFAVADAKVAVAVDRYPDLKVDEAREEITQESEGGNHIILDLGDGRFAGYAHLQSGSVTVKPGDRVRRGQQIGKAGSSGTDGGPHLHFQVMNGPSILSAEGLPYVFDSFLVTGQGPPVMESIGYYETLEPMPITTTNAGPRRNVFPLASDILTFPPAASLPPGR